MKRMHYLLAGLIIPAMLTSCSSEDGMVETPTAPSDKDLPVVKLYANGGGSDTRTTIDNNTGMVNWSGTDQIKVNGRASTSIELTGAHTAIFEVAAVAPYAAVYPSTVVTSFNADGTVSLDVPSEQKYKDGDSFADDVNISVAYSETEQLSFKNVCGLLKATIKADAGATLSKIKKVRFNAGMPISGQAKLNPKTMDFVFSGSTKNYIDVVFDTPKTITGAEEIKLIWSLPPRIYDNWTIELYDETGNILKTISTINKIPASPVSVRRSIISTVKNTQVYPQYYTVQIKSVNGTLDNKGKYWMYKGEERTFKLTSVPGGYSFHKWAITPQEPKNYQTQNDGTLTVTASANQIFDAVVLDGLVVPLYDGNGVLTGKKVLFSSTPLENDKRFFPTYSVASEWMDIPNISTVSCPDGWRFPVGMEPYSVLQLLFENDYYYENTSGYRSYNWYPRFDPDLRRRVFNVVPNGGSIHHYDRNELSPVRGVTNYYQWDPNDMYRRLPVRCVKELAD